MTYETLYSWYLADSKDYPNEEIMSFAEFVEYCENEED